ncbi:alpha/beta hydrolase-fold protein [uncultured Zobellia sp.]|uniref:alpha/beta hydrolase-fold protein n=1 Tax=uncultured Zobellia sp. TaxID=255433 RepID=UPI002595C80D|nr:alpha/beta hydrolase-fold protein [uncultured Zobellia sp.]
MKNLLLFTFIIFSLIGCKQKKDTINIKKQKNEIIIGQIDSLYSNILNEYRELWIHIPESAKDSFSCKTKYPVLYLLDGPSHFSSVTGIIENLSHSLTVPEMIIVGITNTNRTLDLTPSYVARAKYQSGGGNKFLDFIEKELIPHIEKTYPASIYKTFTGHSLGGLSVINALINKQKLFNNYIAIDPSLSWDNRAFLNVADSILSTNKFNNRGLYVGVANTIGTEMDLDSIPDTDFTFHIKSILQFVNSLETKKDNGLLFKWKYYNNDTHASVPLISEYDALRFLFAWYTLNAYELTSRNSTLTAQEIMKLINAHYANISDQFGYEVFPPERLINSMGGLFMSNKMPKKAYTLFKLNIKNYPKSTNVYESMGDYYLSQSDTLNAIKEFKNVLKIGENKTIKKKLERLINRFNKK